MAEGIDRRTFIERGLRTAAGVAVVGGGASGLLAACGSSSSSSSTTSTGSGGVSTATPKRGGQIIFGVGSEDNSMNPGMGRWDGTGYLYAGAVYDSLTALDASGLPQPYLAQSVVPNADYTTWTITLRPGISFHDGTPLDATAVMKNLDNVRFSTLTGSEFTDISSVNTSGNLTVVVNMKSPWVPFPYHLAGQPGFIASPKMLQNTTNPLQAVGTGPFILEEWIPNEHFRVRRNPNYWRQGLPYLDGIEFRPIVDQSAQESSLRTGALDILSTAYAQNIQDFRADSSVTVIDDSKVTVGEPQLSFVMLNLASPPLDDLRVRQALAHATDQVAIWKTLGFGVGEPVNNLFPKGSAFYAPSTYPTYDPAKARSLVQAYQAEKGPISIGIGAIPSAFVVGAAQFLQAQWKSVGINSTISQTEQTQYILNALNGKFQANLWAQFGVTDPDANYVFWSTKNVAPIGQSGIQFPRNTDPLVQQAIDKGRTSTDPTARAQAYQQVSERFNADLPYLWLSRYVDAVAAKNYVQNFANPTFPNGQKIFPILNGVIQTVQIWRAS